MLFSDWEIKKKQLLLKSPIVLANIFGIMSKNDKILQLFSEGKSYRENAKELNPLGVTKSGAFFVIKWWRKIESLNPRLKSMVRDNCASVKGRLSAIIKAKGGHFE